MEIIAEITEGINYLNMQELVDFAKIYSIPTHIYLEKKDKIKKSNQLMRKSSIIKNIMKFLEEKPIKKFIIKKEYLPEKLPKLTPKTLVYYNQYKNGDYQLLKFMKSLTMDQFKFGQIAQEILLYHWEKNDPITYKEFASKWIQAVKVHKKANPEYAYLSDLQKQAVSLAYWKKYRSIKAKQILKLMHRWVPKVEDSSD